MTSKPKKLAGLAQVNFRQSWRGSAQKLLGISFSIGILKERKSSCAAFAIIPSIIKVLAKGVMSGLSLRREKERTQPLQPPGSRLGN